MTTLLIDGDLLAYKYAIVNQEEYAWNPGNPTYVTDLEAAQEALAATIAGWEFDLNADQSVIALSDPKFNWRKDVLKSYKHNRKSQKPLLHTALRDYMSRNWKTYELPTLEGDDVLGILATSPDIVKGKKIVVSTDKDLMSVPCSLYRPHKPNDGVLQINDRDAHWYHMYQTLMGDAVDGYEGCPGTGEKTAERVLACSTIEHDWWMLVCAAYSASKMRSDPIERALQQARVARICQYSDYDFDEKRVIWWSPFASSRAHTTKVVPVHADISRPIMSKLQ